MDSRFGTKHFHQNLLAAALVSGLLAGCAAPQEDGSTNITRSIGTATYGLQGYFQDGSVGQRQVSLQAAALAGAPIDQAALDGSFSTASVRARVGVLVLINAYVTKLAALADSDSSIEDLETAKTLEPQIAGLPRSIGMLRDPTAAQYSAPVATVLDWVGRSYADAQRSQAISDALATAAPAAGQLLDLIGADLKTIQDQRLSGAADLLERERSFYNSNVRRLSLADREALVEAMQDSSAAHLHAETSAPGMLIAALRKMHAALVTYVSSGRTKADQQTVEQAMDDFSDTVEPLVPMMAASH